MVSLDERGEDRRGEGAVNVKLNIVQRALVVAACMVAGALLLNPPMVQSTLVGHTNPSVEWEPIGHWWIGTKAPAGIRIDFGQLGLELGAVVVLALGQGVLAGLVVERRVMKKAKPDREA